MTTDAASRKAPALLYLTTTHYHSLLSHHDSLSLSNLNGSLLQPTATLLPPTATYCNLLQPTTTHYTGKALAAALAMLCVGAAVACWGLDSP